MENNGDINKDENNESDLENDIKVETNEETPFYSIVFLFCNESTFT